MLCVGEPFSVSSTHPKCTVEARPQADPREPKPYYSSVQDRQEIKLEVHREVVAPTPYRGPDKSPALGPTYAPDCPRRVISRYV